MQRARNIRHRKGGKQAESGKKLFGRGIDPAVGRATQIQPGEIRNPGGRPKKKPITEAILAVIESDPTLVRDIAVNLLERAKKSDRSVEMVRDLVQGKPVQEISGADGEPIPLTVEGIDEALMKLIAAAKERQSRAK
jgi:hypothetical protein